MDNNNDLVKIHLEIEAILKASHHLDEDFRLNNLVIKTKLTPLRPRNSVVLHHQESIV
jgi:hypothetical protein